MKSINSKIKNLKLASKLLIFFLFWKICYFFPPLPESTNHARALYVVIKAFQQLAANSLQLFFGCSSTGLPVYDQRNTQRKALRKELVRKALRRELVGKCYKREQQDTTIQPCVSEISDNVVSHESRDGL